MQAGRKAGQVRGQSSTGAESCSNLCQTCVRHERSRLQTCTQGEGEVQELKQKLVKAKRQLLSLKAKLGEATSARDEALGQLAAQVRHRAGPETAQQQVNVQRIHSQGRCSFAALV